MEFKVEWVRFTERDELGSFNVYADDWMYGSVGSHHGAQCQPEDEQNIVEFGDALYRLMRKHFPNTRVLMPDKQGKLALAAPAAAEGGR
jgi:hypothetical protein